MKRWREYIKKKNRGKFTGMQLAYKTIMDNKNGSKSGKIVINPNGKNIIIKKT
jgi:CMP-N-acetylneuraminic acid synthetase